MNTQNKFNRYPRISELMVLQSAAGFYIGRVYYESHEDYNPYSRESGYFRDEETAKQALADNSYVQHFNE